MDRIGSLTECKVCYAIVRESHTELHDGWHVRNGTRSIMGGGMFDRG